MSHAVRKHQTARPRPVVKARNLRVPSATRCRSAGFSKQTLGPNSSDDQIASGERPAAASVIQDVRAIARKLLKHEPAFQFSEEFEASDADSVILAPTPESKNEAEQGEIVSSSLSAYERSLFDVPLLTFEQEQHLFRKMNYLKFRSTQLRHLLDAEHPDRKLVERILDCDTEAEAVRDLLVRANLRLVNAFARTYSRKTKASFDDLRSEGHLALLRAVDCFDYSLGNRFSTYATWAIRHSAGRLSKVTFRDHERFTPVDPVVLREQVSRVPEDNSEEQRELQRPDIRRLVDELLSTLKERESQIVRERFGLIAAGESRTFREIAEDMGISRERVRQLQNQAIERMREALLEIHEAALEDIFQQ